MKKETCKQYGARKLTKQEAEKRGWCKVCQHNKKECK